MYAPNALNTMLGLDVPIVQAPIGPAATPALVNAVASSGGLGMFAGSALGPEQLKAALSEISPANLRRCGVNIINAMPGDTLLKVALDAGVHIISFFWGIQADLIKHAKAAGAIVMQTIGSPGEVKPAIDAGADILVAQGWEAGGHVWGKTSTLALVPACAALAGQTPVIAAGGIANNATFKAALAMGAAGVWMGTRFLASEESGAHDHYKERLVDAGAADTYHGVLYDVGWPDAPARSLANSTLKTWQQAGCPEGAARPGSADIVARDGSGKPLPRYFVDIPTQKTTGDVEAMAQYAGQSVAQITNVLPASDIIKQIIVEA